MMSHTKRRTQLAHPSPNIIAPQTIMPSMGTRGTNGVLKGLSALGSLFLMMITPAHTSTKAKSVPMLVISPTMSPGTKAEKRPMKRNRIIFDLYGVCHVGCMSENTAGISPSFDIE